MEYTIKISPRMLELLSKDLYSNIYFVLAELIANSYDADAENVYIYMGTNEIRIEDDGIGMTPEQIQNDYLFVGKESKNNDENSRTKKKNRIKMGRKGIGKLAALSISNGFKLLSKTEGHQANGIFVPKIISKENETLEQIDSGDISFYYIKEHGTAVVMSNPTIKIPALADTVVNNLGKIFPTGIDDFNIYLFFKNKRYKVESSISSILPRMATIIQIGNSRIDKLPDNLSIFNKSIETITAPVKVFNKNTSKEEETELKIEGWIGTYSTTKKMKKEINEFSDNYLAVFANEKMGARNILDIVGKNRVLESYIVGNLYIDEFENPNYTDMASTNRQSYNENDPRWETAKPLIRDLTDEVIRLHNKYIEKRDENKRLLEQNKLKEKEQRFRQSFNQSKNKAIKQLEKEFEHNTANGVNFSEVIDKSYDDIYKLVGIKSSISKDKRKILISHTTNDKPFADIVYNMLLFNGAPPKDIIYSSSDNPESNLPEHDIYGYLKEFFVQNIGKDYIKVYIVVSNNVLSINKDSGGNVSWGVLMEMGASWIVKEDHKIFNIDDFNLQRPLNVIDKPVNAKSTIIDNERKYTLSASNINSFCAKIIEDCKNLGYKVESFDKNKAYLSSMVILYDPSII